MEIYEVNHVFRTATRLLLENKIQAAIAVLAHAQLAAQAQETAYEIWLEETQEARLLERAHAAAALAA